MPKLWMSGVGTLCAIAHYRAALSVLVLQLKLLLLLLLLLPFRFFFPLSFPAETSGYFSTQKSSFNVCLSTQISEVCS